MVKAYVFSLIVVFAIGGMMGGLAWYLGKFAAQMEGQVKASRVEMENFR
jgi:hypothetical protein